MVKKFSIPFYSPPTSFLNSFLFASSQNQSLAGQQWNLSPRSVLWAVDIHMRSSEKIRWSGDMVRRVSNFISTSSVPMLFFFLAASYFIPYASNNIYIYLSSGLCGHPCPLCSINFHDFVAWACRGGTSLSEDQKQTIPMERMPKLWLTWLRLLVEVQSR